MDNEAVNWVAGFDTFLIAGCKSGLYESAFSDTDWTALSYLPAASVALADSGFFVLSDSGLWFYSIEPFDNGHKFDSIPPAPLSPGSITGFTISSHTKFCAVRNKGVFWSLSDQNTLFPLDTAHLIDKSVTALYSLDLSTSTLFAATASGAVYTIPIDSLNSLGDAIRNQWGNASTMRLTDRQWSRPYCVRGNLVIPMNWPATEQVHATLFNATGRTLAAFNFAAARGSQTITINHVKLARGTCCMELSGEHGSLGTTFIAR
jgi:hypothetical protein